MNRKAIRRYHDIYEKAKEIIPVVVSVEQKNVFKADFRRLDNHVASDSVQGRAVSPQQNSNESFC